ncbi:MAG: glycogen/starch/alpha-glucan phosphorylase [Pseudomonadota bacterium]
MNSCTDFHSNPDFQSPGTEQLLAAIRRHLTVTLGTGDRDAEQRGVYKALAMALRDNCVGRAVIQRDDDLSCGRAQVHYLSMEFLMGRLLANTVHNLQLDDEVSGALRALGADLEELEQLEPDAGLGNGGLGRLAACFIDSCATLDLPVTGYGLRYRYGLFTQAIEDGFQQELPDRWLQGGYPWEIKRPELARRVTFFGHTERYRDSHDREHVRIAQGEDVLAVPYDIPVPGYDTERVNLLRLWSSKPSGGFNLGEFNAGAHRESVNAKNQAEEISMVLYPSDETEAGKLLRLRQQYFLCSASLQDVLASWVGEHGGDFSRFGELNTFQLNDTHPVCAIPELMRLLIDKYFLEWDDAWRITQECMAYTNHTLLPEALERWPLAMFDYLLPRISEIVREIDRRFLVALQQRWPNDSERHARMAIISRDEYPQLRMAHLGVVGSRSVNGVAALHSELLCKTLFREFHEFAPGKFNNKTNGVTHRRWLQACNPRLSELISASIGDGWIREPEQLRELAPHADDAGLRDQWQSVQDENKQRLARFLQERTDATLLQDALVDVQVKRIHEYKRQFLNVLHAIHLHRQLGEGGSSNTPPRTILIAGKAAPGYAVAKLIIKFINSVAAVINADAATCDRLQLLFLPNYSVSAMEIICPAADLSAQLSTAGKEASGTGNMKFMLNGALTLGTMDGANIEIRDAVGDEHFFRFGLNSSEVAELRGSYDPSLFVEQSPQLASVLERLRGGYYSEGNPGIFQPLIDAMLSPQDPWMTAADFDSFVAAQEQAAEAFSDRERWLRSSILNTAGAGRFSSDRTIREYARDIWHLPVA